MASDTAAIVVVVGTRSKTVKANVTAGCNPRRGPHLAQCRFESIELGINAAAFEKALADGGRTSAVPERIQRYVDIAGLMCRDAYEGHRPSRLEGHACHILLF